MTVIPIHSIDDPRLSVYRNLKTTNETRDKRFLIAEGVTLLRRLLASPYQLESVLVSETQAERLIPLIPADVPVFVTAHACLEELVGFHFHRGVLACAQRHAGPTMSELLVNPPVDWMLVVCPDVKDPENLGAIIRNSSAFGVDAILLGSHCCDPFSRRVLRVSMGTVLQMPLVSCDDLERELQQLRAAGVQLAATVLDDNAEHLDEAARPGRFALLFGSEGHGLEHRWIELCDRRITIPMQRGTDSLNVAAASGVCLYHFTQFGSKFPDSRSGS